MLDWQNDTFSDMEGDCYFVYLLYYYFASLMANMYMAFFFLIQIQYTIMIIRDRLYIRTSLNQLYFN